MFKVPVPIQHLIVHYLQFILWPMKHLRIILKTFKCKFRNIKIVCTWFHHIPIIITFSMIFEWMLGRCKIFLHSTHSLARCIMTAALSDSSLIMILSWFWLSKKNDFFHTLKFENMQNPFLLYPMKVIKSLRLHV